jgi:sigma-70-like protein
MTLAEDFEAERPHQLRVAYGQLGGLAEAEDVVQDAWLRLQRVDPDEIRDLRGWLTTTVSRVVLRSDGGGRVPTARKPLEGADRVARMVLAVIRKSPPAGRWIDVNGMPGLLTVVGGVTTVYSFTIDDGRIVEIDVIRNPEKLKGVVA